MRPIRLVWRTWIAKRAFALEDETVVTFQSGRGNLRCPPAVLAGGHREFLLAELQFDRFRQWSPNADRGHQSISFRDKRATGNCSTNFANRMAGPGMASPVSSLCQSPGGNSRAVSAQSPLTPRTSRGTATTTLPRLKATTCWALTPRA